MFVFSGVHGIVSEIFLACDGEKQADVLSPVFFGLYVDGLPMALSDAVVGCFLGDVILSSWSVSSTYNAFNM